MQIYVMPIMTFSINKLKAFSITKDFNLNMDKRNNATTDHKVKYIENNKFSSTALLIYS